jgi:hypothetical protein
MLSDIWSFFQDETNRAVLAWIGAGGTAVVGAAWAALKFILSRRTGQDLRAHTVTATRGGIAAGHDVSVGIHLGLNEQETARRIAEAHRPLEEKLMALADQVARDKGVAIAALRPTLIKLGEKNVSDEEIPTLLEKKADELITLRQTLVDLRMRFPDLASVAQQAQDFLDRGNFKGALTKLFEARDCEIPVSILMQSDNQKQQMERWKVLQDTQAQIFSIQEDRSAQAQLEAYHKWDKYIRD